MGCHDEVAALLGVAVVWVAPPRTTVEGEFAISAVRDINADLGDDNTIVFGCRIGFVKCGAMIGDVVSRSRYPPTNKKRTAIVPNIQFGIEMRGMRIRERRGADGCRFALFIASIITPHLCLLYGTSSSTPIA